MRKIKQKQYKQTDANKPLRFRIEQSDIDGACQADPSSCVVAQAIRQCLPDGMLEGVEVGSNVTKVYVAGKAIRYTTPGTLKKHIPVFDRTGAWSLPVGEYTLKPLCPSARLGGRPSRWQRKHKTKQGGGRDMFKARNLPTRQVSIVRAAKAA